MFDRIVRSRRKTLALEVHPDRRVVVRAPLGLSEEIIRRFVEQKRGWIQRKQDELQLLPISSGKKFFEGEEFLYLGKSYRLKIIGVSGPPLQFDNGFFLAEGFHSRARKIFRAWYGAETLRLVGQRIEHFSDQARLTYRSVKVTHAMGRWGSCSWQGRLNFSWRLSMAPLHVMDYVVVHELMHLKEKNHGLRFWESVRRLIPEYPLALAWLKTNAGRMAL